MKTSDQETLQDMKKILPFSFFYPWSHSHKAYSYTILKELVVNKKDLLKYTVQAKSLDTL